MPHSSEGGPNFLVLRFFQESLVPWSTSLLTLRVHWRIDRHGFPLAR
jgi:hypothetical protein